jgi:hypothetical protein
MLGRGPFAAARSVALSVFLVAGAAGCECAPARPSGDAGVAICTADSGTPTRCDDAPPELSAETCRCGSHYYWDGTSCVSTSACSCYANCARFFDTDAACEAAYASCRGDGARP